MKQDSIFLLRHTDKEFDGYISVRTSIPINSKLYNYFNTVVGLRVVFFKWKNENYLQYELLDDCEFLIDYSTRTDKKFNVHVSIMSLQHYDNSIENNSLYEDILEKEKDLLRRFELGELGNIKFFLERYLLPLVNSERKSFYFERFD